MDIWLINHYAVPPKYYPLARQTYFAKHLMAMGHTVTIFAASTVHNSDKNLITDGSSWREETVDGVHYVYIKCLDYQGNGLKRVYNLCEFAWKLPGVCKKFPRPGAIVATSMPPTSCAMGIHLARKYRCRGVAEIADLWPESIVALGYAGKYNPAVLLLRRLEKWIYKKADAVVFTMEGGYDYIAEQGWSKEIPRSKVFHINNGVELAEFDENRRRFRLEDPDLENPEKFKVVYCGSIRPANGVDQLVECAARLKENRGIQFLIYGAGDDLENLREKAAREGLTNLAFKGRVDKAYIPYILSKSDLNVLNYTPDSVAVFRFGSSQNKLFEYLASGKPVLSNVKIAYSIIDRHRCGVSLERPDPSACAEAVLRLSALAPEERAQMGRNARAAAEEYDFEKLTRKLWNVISGS